ncbi:MAG: molybdopterin-guanine dinucleotide biosynthesis protein MobB [Clostridia bacterium]
MRVFSVTGPTRSGKTTTIEGIIAELRRRRYSVGSVKEIHYEDFSIDTPGTNTDRHYRAGSQQVCALGLGETDMLYKRRLNIREVLEHFHHDFVVCEGVEDPTIPRILTAERVADLKDRFSGNVFAVSGKIAVELEEFRGLSAIDATRDVAKLVNLIEAKTFPLLPGVDPACCGACGYSCEQLTAMILKGEATPADCPVLNGPRVRLTVAGNEIPMVPFVQTLLENAVIGVAGELEGYRRNARVEVQIDPKGRD